jgi:WD40 repeat protein
VGTAKVVARFDSWKAGNVAPTQQEVPVSLPKQSTFELKAVSPRLKQELIHPNRTSTLGGLSFSQDGKRLVAGDFPGGAVVVWDVATGKQLNLIETGHGRRFISEYFFVSPDWKTVYVSQYKSKAQALDQEGKRLWRWQFDGDVRAWDVNTGQLAKKYKHDPPRSVSQMRLFEDGSKFLTIEALPGTYEAGPKGAISMWDVPTGRHRSLPDHLSRSALNSPDGSVLAVTEIDEDRYVRALKLLDLTTWREKWSTPIKDQGALLDLRAFSPDGRLIVAEYEVFGKARRRDTRELGCRWYDAASGQQVASFVGKDGFYGSCFSPDGQTLAAATGWLAETAQLFLFSVAEKKLMRTIALAAKKNRELAVTIGPVFSPDGRWLAVGTQMVPDVRGAELDPRDVPQARIHLIDVAAGEIRETLVAPQGLVRSMCFSPDGRTLATGGLGRVLLWNLSTPPGARVDANHNERHNHTHQR